MHHQRDESHLGWHYPGDVLLPGVHRANFITLTRFLGEVNLPAKHVPTFIDY